MMNQTSFISMCISEYFLRNIGTFNIIKIFLKHIVILFNKSTLLPYIQ